MGIYRALLTASTIRRNATGADPTDQVQAVEYRKSPNRASRHPARSLSRLAINRVLTWNDLSDSSGTPWKSAITIGLQPNLNGVQATAEKSDLQRLAFAHAVGDR